MSNAAVPLESPETATLEQVAELLGGARVLKAKLGSPLDAHELLLRGLPGASLSFLLDKMVLISAARSLEKAVGVSVRTIQRRRGHPGKPLSRDQSGRTWKFAEILARATKVFGSRGEAEKWLERPAVGLDQRRPIDLLATTAGTEIVENHLERLEYGVYT